MTLRTWGLILAGAVLMLLPAAWNGYPLLFFDTADYIPTAFGHELPVYRTASYGVFTGLGRLAGSLWMVVLVQALAISTLLVLGAERLTGDCSGRAGALALAASVLGLLPWYAGQVMADGWTVPLLLAATALILPARQEGAGRTLLLVLLCALGAALHTSHIGLMAGLLLLAGALALARRRWPGLPPAGVTGVLAVLLLSVGLAAGANALVTGRLFVSQPATVQTLALFVQNGLAKRWLDEECVKPLADPPRLCPHRDRLPETANEFLWANEVWGVSPFRSLGGFAGMQAEAERIVGGVMRRYPLALAGLSLEFTVWQFVRVAPGDGLYDMKPWIGPLIQRFYPGNTAAFNAARQQQDDIVFTALVPWVVGLYLLGVLAMAVLAPLLIRRGRGRLGWALLLLLAGLWGNAFICGALSNPNDRYQGRLTALPLVALVLLPGAGRRMAPHT